MEVEKIDDVAVDEPVEKIPGCASAEEAKTDLCDRVAQAERRAPEKDREQRA